MNFCTNCGTARAREASSFCSTCGSALDGHPVPRTTPQSGGASITIARGRNIAHVLLGALGGFWLGLAFVGVLLFFSPRDKRADRLFGAWLGTAAGGLVLAAIVVAISMSSSSGATTNTSSSQPGVQPDRVVGVSRVCVPRGGLSNKLVSDGCPDYMRVMQDVTVRTPNGGAYDVKVPVGTSIKVGDVWPPTR